MKNYYQTLGVSPSATLDEIKVAYKRLSKKVHPDVNWGDKIFEELFKNINEAYQVLSDEEQRREYNRKYNHFFFAASHHYLREETPMQAQQVRQMYPPNNKLKRKIILNGVICLLMLFAFVGVNALIFENEEKPVAESFHSNSQVAVAETPPASAVAAVIKPAVLEVVTPVVETKLKEVVPPVATEEVTEVEKTKPVKQLEAKPIEAVKEVVPQAAVKKPAAKQQWSEQEMLDVVEKIKAEKARTGSKATCIRLHQSSNSNISNGFSIASYLQMNNFSIAGRLTTAKATTGVGIDFTADCIVVTIGNVAR
ncbi:J domain-containing protein [Aridibaculum aurantiacum]|uniref:J domain-containing protein n=1 Tax=Aridibaculum aurantiacum TaxID=2810307 RepID=UPI001A963D84|nr:DnaJ domain-containing protein [Aridibaculum aurantiacum]